MTLLELRDVIKSDTVFYLKSGDYEFRITNILWGCDSFVSMNVCCKSVSVGERSVTIETDMPDSVFQAWKNYSVGK